MLGFRWIIRFFVRLSNYPDTKSQAKINLTIYTTGRISFCVSVSAENMGKLVRKICGSLTRKERENQRSQEAP